MKDQQQPVLFDKDLGLATAYYDRTYQVAINRTSNSLKTDAS